MSLVKKSISNIFLLNLLFFKQQRIFNIQFFKEKKIYSQKKNILIELQLHNPLIMIIYVLLSKIFHNHYNLTFFYYSKFDSRYFSLPTKIGLFFYINFIKKKLKGKIINFYNKSSKEEIELAKKFFKNVKNINDLIKIKYKKILIGKYIHQSYCRELVLQNCDVKDERLISFICQAITYVNYLNKFFKKNRFEKLFISHSIFIRYGILCRMAHLYSKSKIFILFLTSENSFFGKLSFLKINPPHFLQMERYWNFRKEFKKLNFKKKATNKSRKDLYERIYKAKLSLRLLFKNNPYKGKILKLRGKKPKIIILPSCFFDSMQFFRNSLFLHNFSWLENLLRIASKTDFEWYIKPHPDQKLPNSKIIKYFKMKYPFLKILPSSISNFTFKKNNFKSMFTFNGSSIHEFLYLGIPTVSVSDNKQAGYSFGKPVNNLKNFKKIIFRADKLKLPRNLKKDIYEFNYMYTFRKSNDWISTNFFNKKIGLSLKKMDLVPNFFSRYSFLCFFLKSVIDNKLDALYEISKKL